MLNPWLKKNPFMSLWLSTAHRIAGAARGQAQAALSRQVWAGSTEATPTAPRRRPAMPAAPKTGRKR